MKKDLITVFVARPADAKNKVETIKKICDGINNNNEQYKEYILLVKDFSSFPSQGGKPQPKANQCIQEEAKIFIGIADNSKGKGRFEEEVDLGLQKEKKGDLKFAFFFNEKNKKTFKNLLKKIGEGCIYKGYKNNEELYNHASNSIHSFLGEIIKEKQANNKDNSTNETFPKKYNKKALKAEKSSLAPIKEESTLEKILKDTKEAFDKKKPDEFEQARLFLYAAGILYNNRLPSETLNNHELHLLYIHKEKVKCTGNENRLIFRSILDDGHNLKTGWYWLKDIELSILASAAISFIYNDASEDVRCGALAFLKNNWEEKYYEILSDLTDEKSINILKKILSIIKDKSSLKGIKIAEKLIDHKENKISEEAVQTKLKLLAENDPHGATSFLIQHQDNEKIIYIGDRIEKLIKNANIAELNKLAKHNQQKVQALAYKELIRRKKIDKKELKELKKRKNWEIRYLALKALLDVNENIEITEIEQILKEGKPSYLFEKEFDENTIKKKALEKMKFEELMVKISFYGINGYLAYEVIGKQFFTKFKKRLFQNLNDDFDGFRKDNIKTLIQELTNETKKDRGIIEKYVKENYEDEKINDFLRKQFIIASLKILQDNYTNKNSEIARKFILHNDLYVRKEAFLLLSKFGSQKDSLFLIQAALEEKNKYYENEAIKGAINLDKHGKYKVIEKFLKSEHEKGVCMTLNICKKAKIQIRIDTLKELLKSNITSIRETTIEYLLHNFAGKRKKLEEILNWYNTEGTFYYDVINILDKILFSPKGEKEACKKRLETKLTRWN